MSLARRFIRRHIERRTAVEEMERKNAVQYLLMVYLGANGPARMSEEMRTSEHGSKRRPYPRQSSESHPGGGHVESGFARTSVDE